MERAMASSSTHINVVLSLSCLLAVLHLIRTSSSWRLARFNGVLNGVPTKLDVILGRVICPSLAIV